MNIFYPFVKMMFIISLLFFATCSSEAFDFQAPFVYNVSSEADENVVIGTVKANVSIHQHVYYYLGQVLETQPINGSKTANETSSWQQLALDKDNNDCSSETLEQYEGRRKMFCINHTSGELFTTSFYVVNVDIGQRFFLEISAEQDNTTITKWYSVVVLNFCDIQKESYVGGVNCVGSNKPEKVSCRPNSTDEKYWTCQNITSTYPYYAVGVEITIVNTKRNRITGEISLDGNYKRSLSSSISQLPFTKTYYYDRAVKLIDNIHFQETTEGFLRRQFGGNFTIKQLIISDNYETCSNLNQCSAKIAEIDFNAGCFVDDFVLNMQNRACKGKSAPVSADQSYSIDLPINRSMKIGNQSQSNSSTLLFQIRSVDGPVLHNVNVSLDYPSECVGNDRLNTNQSYFCVNSQTGDLYFTTNIRSLPSSSVSFNILIMVIDQSYPMKYTTKTVQLILKNNCERHSKFLDELQLLGCEPILKKILPTKGYGDKLNFNLSFSHNQLVAAEISNITIAEGKNLSLLLMSKNFTSITVFKKEIYSEVVVVPLQLPYDADIGKELNVSILTNSRSYVLTVNSVSLLYAADWSTCNNDVCIRKYQEFQNGTKQPFHCSAKDQYATIYLESCQDLKPMFINGPIQNGTALSGCDYMSKVSFQTFTYWLVNNTSQKRTFENTTTLIPQSYLFQFPHIVIEETFEPVSYRCGVFDTLRMKKPIFSDSIIIQRKELLPIFISHPEQNGKILKGCRYNSSKSLSHYTYWLLNGTIRINASDISANDSIGVNLYKFPELSSEIFEEYTSYQCGLFSPKEMKKPVLSKAIYPKIFDLETIFITGPKKSGRRVTGCLYNSSSSLTSYAYWIVNGTTAINATLQSEQTSPGSFEFPPLVLNSFEKYNTSYQCAIFDSNRMYAPALSAVIYFEDIELQVEFISEPKQKGYTLGGCSYNSTSSLARYTYWLINGTFNEHLNATLQSHNIGPTLHSFPKLSLETLENNTFYQCGIYDPNRMAKAVISKKIYPKWFRPRFMEGDKLPQSKAGVRLEIPGCIYDTFSNEEIRYLHWIKDGNLKLNIERKNVREIPNNISSYQYQTPSLIFNYTLPVDQGTYQCVMILKDGSILASPKISIQFKDFSFNSLSITLSISWNPRLLNGDLTQTLKSNITDEITALTSGYGFVDWTKRFVIVAGFSPNGGNVTADAHLIYNDVNQSQILNICKTLNSDVKNGKYRTNLMKGVELQSFDCCLEDTQKDEKANNQYTFSTTIVGKSSIVACGNATDNMLVRQCEFNISKGAFWSSVDFGYCVPDFANELQKITEKKVCSNTTRSSCSTVIEVAHELSTSTANKTTLNSTKEVQLVGKIVSKITANVEEIKTVKEGEAVLNDVLTCINVVVSSPKSIIPQNTPSDDNKADTSTNILRDLEILADKMGTLLQSNKEKSVSVSKENIAVEVTEVRKKTDVYVVQNDIDGKMGTEITTINETGNANAVLRIPKEALKHENTYIHSYVYRFDNLFQSRRKTNTMGEHSHLSIDGKVLSVSVGGAKVDNLQNPIELRFRKNKYLHGKRNCYFWDFNTSDDGRWSTEGCRYKSEDRYFVLCQCNHLTNFALLLDVSQSSRNPFELKIVTWIGCGISLAGILLTILTYVSLRKLRAKLAPKLLLCLCFSLMMLLLTFIFGTERTESQTICQLIASLLQFFTLSTFSWMAVEAYNLYRCFVRIFKSNVTDSQFLLRSSLVAWGVPLAITTTTALVKPENLGTDELCIVHGRSFYFGLLLPVAVILLGNYLVLYLVITGINAVAKSTSTSKRDQQETVARSRVAFTCSVLLGLSWVFGVLALGDLTVAFQWLFCIFNSLQGFFIFIFYTIKNKEVWDEWKKVLGLRPSKDFNSSISGFKKSSRVGLYASNSNSNTSQRSSTGSKFSFWRKSKYFDDVFSEHKM